MRLPQPISVLCGTLLAIASGCWTTPGAGDASLDAGRRDADTRRDATIDVATSDASTRQSFRLATWNLQEFPRSPRTIELAAQVITEQNLPLVGIQEITDRDAFDTLAEQLGYEAIVSFGSDGFTRVGFLYDPALIVVSDIERLFPGDGFAFPRSPIKAVIEVLDPDGETLFDFVFVVVHLKARGDAESRMRRLFAIAELDRWARQTLEGPEQDLVIVGDFNDAIDDSPATNVYGPIQDAPEVYRFLTDEAVERGDYTYPFFESFIDHILVTTDALGEYGPSGTTEVLHLERELPEYFDDLSDHLPVVTTFRAL